MFWSALMVDCVTRPLMFRISASPVGGHGREVFHSQTRILFLVSIVICIAALAGIGSRPIGFLATFWPANPIFAALLVRMPRRYRPSVVVGALLGYQAAGYISGEIPWLNLQLTGANMASAVAFAFAYVSMGERTGFARARQLVSLAGASTIAAAAAGVSGGPIWVNFAGASYFDAWRMWFSSELMNYLVLMPGLIAMPWPLSLPGRAALRRFVTGPLMLPICATIGMIVLGLLAASPIALVLPVPALIWVALVLPVPATCLLVTLYSGVTMFALKLNLYDFGNGLSEDLIASVHLGVAMIALAPVLVATYNAERRNQLRELERAARIDMLTEALNRAAFVKEAEGVLRQLSAQNRPAAAIVVDVDHFKHVNDLHGHAAGDMALMALSAAIRKSIRQHDLFGRLGGEEFGLLLPGASPREAGAVAERLRAYVERMQTTLGNGDVLKLTISVGISNSADSTADLSEMLLFADRAMYEAKRAGRNQVQVQNVPA